MPTTSYTDSTFSVAAISNRTDAAGGAVTDVSSEEMRLVAQIVSEGYLNPAESFEVKATSTASMSVTVGSGGAKADHYVVTGEAGGQGNYIVRLDVTSATVALNAADASQARTDEIYLVVQDNAYDASSRGLPRIAYRKGDLGGANPGPDTAWKASVLLARIAVAATSTTVEDEDITDMRSAAGWKPAGDLDVNLGNQLNVGGSTSAASVAVLTPAFWAETLSTRQVGDANNRFAIHADGFLDWGGGTAAVDTSLYRQAAGVLRTDGNLQIGGTAVLGSTSSIVWAGDTNLYRVLANILKTDDSFAVAGELFMDAAAAGITFGGGGASTRIWRQGVNTLKVDSDFWVEDGLFVDGGLGGKGVGIPQLRAMTSDTTVTNSTVAVTTSLSAPMEANATYQVEGFLNYSSATANGMIGLIIPSGATGSWTAVDDVVGISSEVLVAPQGYAQGLRMMGTVFTGAAGTFAVKIRQLSASTAPTQIRAHSWLRVTRAV